MIERSYEPVLLFSGVLTSIGTPEELFPLLEKEFGKIVYKSEEIPFDFTTYYDEEMKGEIRRYFIAFSPLITPDRLKHAKKFTNELEKRFEIDGGRRINLDPGTISVSNIVLATTKNRAHRIAIGDNLFAEVTLIYHKNGFESFSWTYTDYKDERVQQMLLDMRRIYLELRRNAD